MKKLLITNLLVLILLVFTNCEKDESTDPNIIKPGTEEGYIAKSVIGRGYDISEEFANTEKIKEAVLDFTKLTNGNKIVIDRNIAKTETKSNEGTTIQEYQYSFDYARSSTISFKGLFSAEAGQNFSYARAKSTGYSYATISSYTYKYGIYIDGRLTPSSLSDFANEQFLEDAESKTVEELISSYGTHVIVAGKWGASFQYNMSARRIQESNEVSISAYAKAEATIKGISIAGSQSGEFDYSTYFDQSTIQESTKAIGGNSEYTSGILAMETAEARDLAYSTWLESIDENPAFCDYYEKGLVPIYEFIEDETLKNKIKDGIQSYLDDKEIETIEPVDYTVYNTFQVANFCSAIGNGDDEIDADGNGDIYIEVSLTIDKQMLSNNLELIIDLKVHEMKGDYSKIEGQTTKTIVNNEEISSIELENRTFTFSSQYHYNPADGQYLDFSHFQTVIDCEWIKELSVCIDGSGGDEAIIGVKGKLEVPVKIIQVTTE